jgi:hypothetical protein
VLLLGKINIHDDMLSHVLFFERLACAVSMYFEYWDEIHDRDARVGVFLFMFFYRGFQLPSPCHCHMLENMSHHHHKKVLNDLTICPHCSVVEGIQVYHGNT